MNPSFAIEYFEERFNDTLSEFKLNFYRIKTFFDLIFEVLEEEGLKYRKIILGNHLIPMKDFSFNEIYFAYHKHGDKKNVFFIKESYILDNMYFDKNGFSGWSELARNEELFNMSQMLNLSEAKSFYSSYVKEYKENNLSKYKQLINNSELPDNFIFVALQKPNDLVMKLAYIETYELAKMVVEAYKNSGIYVVIKPHPLDDNFNKNIFDNKENVIISDQSIFSILPKASAIYTVNSGVGFESLFYGKKVFTSGASDYNWVTTMIRNFDDIKKTRNNFDVDLDQLIKFVYFFLNKYTIRYNDKKEIRSRIIQLVRNFEVLK
jgi:capsule polysaccharide export protein KpsC/LpsZ